MSNPDTQSSSESDAVLAPEAVWQTCSRCQTPIPRFQMAAAFKERLLDLLSRGRKSEAMFALREASGCDVKIAKLWVTHYGLEHFANHGCPFCGQPLRTPRAKQCRYCQADWHDS